jgi:Ser/Thr protein kinase RdoA (MazF antagonist)
VVTPPGAAGGVAGPEFLAHGMGKDLVAPDWPPLTDDEAAAVLARYGRPGPVDVRWRSPRPMSAAALVLCGGGREARGRGREKHCQGEDLFVKRHHRSVRTEGQLAAEHAFAAHLRALGVAVPTVLRTVQGDGEGGMGRRVGDAASTVRSGDYVYEVHARAEGLDLYRDVASWSPFTSPGHARAAGAALARFHLASASFGLPARPPEVLTSSCAIVTAADPLAEVARLAARRPGLARYLDRRPWRDELARYHLPAIGALAPLLPYLGRLWGHGDFHPSNLTWTSASPDAEVVAIIDLGLANRTFAAHDLAVAIERSAVGWLDLAGTGRASVDIPAVDALLDGYQAIRTLTRTELAAVAELLPVAHLEYALSEVEYFASVVCSPGNADLAYHTYLIGHTRWFGTPEGSELLSHLRRRVADDRRW